MKLTCRPRSPRAAIPALGTCSTTRYRWVNSYITTTRQVSIDRARRRGRYDKVSRLVVTDISITTNGIKLKYLGRWRRHDDIEISDRLKMFIDTDDGPEPLWLWLSEARMPLPGAAWTDVMSDGNDRVFNAFKEAREAGRMERDVRPPRLSPHSLRHFALYMLIALHHAVDARDGRTDTSGYNEERYRRS